MLVPYPLLFVALLVVYLVYSEWAGLDPRYPVGAALVLLVATAAAEAGGASGTANDLAEYVFFLLAGGVVLLLVDHLRTRPLPSGGSGSTEARFPPGPSAQSSNERDRTPDQVLHRPEQ